MGQMGTGQNGQIGQIGPKLTHILSRKNNPLYATEAKSSPL